MQQPGCAPQPSMRSRVRGGDHLEAGDCGPGTVCGIPTECLTRKEHTIQHPDQEKRLTDAKKTQAGEKERHAAVEHQVGRNTVWQVVHCPLYHNLGK